MGEWIRGLLHQIVYGCVVAARAVVYRLPPAIAVRLGGAVGGAYAHLHGPRTGTARRNIQLAFPDWSEERRRALLVESFRNAGRCLAEAALLQGPQREALLEGVCVEGEEYADIAKAGSTRGGVIVLTAHFGSWEVCGSALARAGYPLSVVHHRIANPHLEKMVTGWRVAAGQEALELGRAGLSVVRALRRGRFVAMLFDQNAGREEGVFVPFFGVEASTRVGPVMLAMRHGFAVVPVLCFREGSSARHVVRVYPQVEIEESGDDPGAAMLRNAERMNAALESAVREAPELWLWGHRRWKTRPKGAPPLYPPRSRIRRRLRRRLRRAASAFGR